MTRRFLAFVIEWLLPILILSAAVGLLLVALNRGPSAARQTSYDPAIPSLTAAAALSASEWRASPLTPLSTTRPASIGGGGAFPAGGSNPLLPSANQKAEAGGHRTPAPTGSGGASPPPSFPATCQSVCAVDVSEWDIPTPEPVAVNGIASHMGYGFPAWYLALPQGPGFIARICGPGGCVTRTSTDAGPSKAMQRYPHYRVADLSVQDFERVCGCPASMGLVPVSVAIVGRR